jgi:hypothetical protein
LILRKYLLIIIITLWLFPSLLTLNFEGIERSYVNPPRPNFESDLSFDDAEQSFLTNEKIFHEPNISIKKPIPKITQSEYLELKEFSEHYHYGNGTIGFSSRLGDQNTWDGDSYEYYVWNDIEKSIQYANSKIFFYDWYARVEQFGQTVVDDSRWIVEYWRTQGGGSWNTLDLFNHQWFNPIIETKKVTFIQGYNDGLNYLNVSYVVTNNAAVKINIDYLSGETREVRFVWQLTGMDGSIDYIQSKREFSFADIIISCNDTELSTGFEYEWQVSSKKLDVRLGSFNVVANDWISIDPTFSEKQTVDEQDWRGYFKSDTVAYHITTTDDELLMGRYEDSYYHYNSSIVWDSGITGSIASTSNAEMTFYCTYESVEANEYIGLGLYFNTSLTGGFWNETYGSNYDEIAIKQDCYYTDSAWHAFDGETTTNVSFNDAIMGTFIDEWVTNHNTDPGNRQYVNFKLFTGDGIDAEDDMAKVSESTDTPTSQRPTLTFTYTLSGGGNTAPSAVVHSAVSSNLYAGIEFTAVSNHTDSDGAADLDRAYLGLGASQFDITFNSSVGVGSLSVSTDNGSGYITSVSSSGSSITNGYQITWTIILDWDFPFDDLSTIDTHARSRDDEPEYSSWDSHNTNANFENDLETVGFNVSISSGAVFPSTGWIEDNSWFRGGVEVTGNGSVEYEGSSQTFNSSYATTVNVTLFYDGASTSQADTVILSGVFSGITYTPTSASGLDTTAYFDVQVLGIPTNGSDITGAAVEITSKRDNQDPTTTFHSITEDNPHTYIYATGQTVYFSDEMGVTDQLCTIAVNASDGSGSAIYAVEMSAWDDDAIQNDTTYPYQRQYSTDSSETSGSITMYAIDNVGNTDSSPVTITMTEDTTDPTFSVSPDSDSASIGYAPNTNYDDDSTIDFTASGASDGGSGLPTNCYSWNNSAWESSTTKQYSGQSDGNISLTVVLRDNVGNNGTEQTWIIVDTDSPTGFTITWTRVNGTYPISVFDSNSTIYFDPGNQCNNYTTITANNNGEINNSAFWKLEWDKNSVFETGANDTSGLPDNKNFYYLGDTNGTFLIRIINNAGNYQTFNYTAYDTLDGGCGEPPTTTTAPQDAPSDGDGGAVIQEPPFWYSIQFAWYIWMVIWAGAGIIVSGAVFYYFMKQLL